jgi:hypothetical protein
VTPQAAMSTLSASMTEALLAIGRMGVTAHEIGVNGLILKALAARGLLVADRNGLPPIYHISAAGIEVVAALTEDVAPIDREGAIARIQRVVAAHYHIPLIEMVSARRARMVARPRQVAMWIAKQTTTKSLPDIGRRFGGRDHTTVMHAIRRVEQIKTADLAFDREVTTLLLGLVTKKDVAVVDNRRFAAFAETLAGA